jgi:superoxide dismutase, Fe-Mn family
MFNLPDLPFPHDALEPLMSRQTLETHHGKHHAAYIKTTNALLAERADAPASLEEVVRFAKRENQTKLFNNAAQAWNHGFFWQCLSPTQQRAEGALGEAIQQAFGEGFNEQFVTQGSSHFASGWLWLVTDASGAVKLIDLHDADTPIAQEGLTPLLVADVWEHAYYLDHKNDRGAFLRAFVDKLVNWRFAEAQYEAARAGKPGWRFPN